MLQGNGLNLHHLAPCLSVICVLFYFQTITYMVGRDMVQIDGI